MQLQKLDVFDTVFSIYLALTQLHSVETCIQGIA